MVTFSLNILQTLIRKDDSATADISKFASKKLTLELGVGKRTEYLPCGMRLHNTWPNFHKQCLFFKVKIAAFQDYYFHI